MKTLDPNWRQHVPGRLPARVWAFLLVSALAFHAITAVLFSDRIWVTSVGIGSTLTIAMAYCLIEMRTADREMRWRWLTLAVFFFLWILALASIVWLQVVTDVLKRYEPIDSLLYTLRGVPILLLLVRAGDGRRQKALDYLDATQALLFSALVILLLFPGTILGSGPAYITDDITLVYHDIQNFVLAFLALISLIDRAPSERRRLKRGLAALLLTYAVLAAITNHLFIYVKPPPPPGSPANMMGDLPVVAFFLMILRRQREPARSTSRIPPTPTLLLRSLLPAAFCIGSLLIAMQVGYSFPVVGIVGGAFALALFATRSAYVQFELAGLQQLFGDVIAGLPDAVCVVDADGRITLANVAAESRLGSDLVGREIAPILARLGPPSVSGQIKDADASLILAEAELAKGLRIVRLTDITAVRRAEREREEALQFLSHDMRTPQAAIVTLLGMPGLVEGREGPIEHVLHRVGRLARQGLALADDFVRLARLREMRVTLEPVDLEDAVTEAVDLVWPMARERGIRLSEDSRGPVWALADRSLIVRSVQNLVDNAVKFAPPQSTVTYSISGTGQRATVEVVSEGPDLPPARAKALFKRFATGTDSDTGDSIGLGLSFVQHAVELMNGRIRHRRHENIHHFTINLELLGEDV